MIPKPLHDLTMGVDHTAFAVRSLDKAAELYVGLLGGTPFEGGVEAAQGFRWIGIRYPNGTGIELLEPYGDGFIGRFIERRGEGLHHLSIVVTDLQKAIAALHDGGVDVIDESHEDAHWPHAFIRPRDSFGTIIQVAQTDLTNETRRRHWPLESLWSAAPAAQ